MLVQQSLIPIFASNSSTVAVLIVEPWINIQQFGLILVTHTIQTVFLLWPSKYPDTYSFPKQDIILLLTNERATADASGLIRHRLYVQRNCHKRKTTQHIKQNSTLAGFLQRRVARLSKLAALIQKGGVGGK